MLSNTSKLAYSYYFSFGSFYAAKAFSGFADRDVAYSV